MGDMVRYEKKTDFITPLEEPLGAFIKRTFDITAALFLITLTLPLMCFCAVGVKISLGSPVIFRQRRVGRYGREFVMLKFRSMRVGTPSGFNGGSDKRKTRFGHFLRLTSLDELPQLFNVLAGQMSFVGTRPEVGKYVDRYSDEMMATLLLPAGVTSPASIRFKNEDEKLSALTSRGMSVDEAYVNVILPEKMELNLQYLREFTFFGDLAICIKTVL
jgi:lipopolysaccharide/colanic/teichoic acid biosynthesis glycosyltransferase